jgi:hypothetical protein
MSKIEVDAIEPQSGTSLTLGASGDTITVPSGATLVNSGTASGFGDNLEWQSAIVTAATITVTANKGYWINTTSNACTITLPAAAAVGDQIIFTDYLRTWGSNAITINPNSLKFQGYTTPQPVYDTSGQSVNLVYSGATQGWIPNSDDDVALETPQSYTITYLVIAGGGSGGKNYAGGGGAGGYLTSTFNASLGNTVTSVIGSGGAGVGSNGDGNVGANSTMAVTGLSTITAFGGGYGQGSNTGASGGGEGGSGGGASGPNSGGTGTVGQGTNGGNSMGGSNTPGAGGGGAGAAAANTSSDGVSTVGGAGLSSSITGSAVTRAGGGGGTTELMNGVAGGAGGGGAGDTGSGGVAGTANTGSGGGGGDGGGDSGAGGSGLVILRMLDADYSGTTTGSPTVATGVSGNTILTFNGNGTYTA